MSSVFLRALAKAKLIELDEASEFERDNADAQDEAPAHVASTPMAPPATRSPSVKPPSARAPSDRPTAAAVPPTSAPASLRGAHEPVQENRDLADYYTSASVPVSPYPAEKLLRVLDGLRAMDSGTRKAAIVAMDAADESWTLADVVLDAQRKIEALTESAQAIRAQVARVEMDGKKERDARDAYLTEATATIRRKIAELEKTLQSEIADIANQKAEIDTRVRDAQLAGQREITRLGAEAERLREIQVIFGPLPPQAK